MKAEDFNIVRRMILEVKVSSYPSQFSAHFQNKRFFEETKAAPAPVIEVKPVEESIELENIEIEVEVRNVWSNLIGISTAILGIFVLKGEIHIQMHS